jgi:23S rRNA (guanosine2251-2'-O)-methyltransferase
MKKLTLDELGRDSVDSFKSKEKLPIVAVLDSVRSALNVGSVFRTADAFAIEKIVLCGITATPPNREITKTAIGATESVDWVYENDIVIALKELKSQGYFIIGVEQTDQSKSLNDFDVSSEKIAVIFGNEVDGISDEALEMIDHCIEIPQFGTKHSLNVSVCAGIVLWEMMKKYR